MWCRNQIHDINHKIVVLGVYGAFKEIHIEVMVQIRNAVQTVVGDVEDNRRDTAEIGGHKLEIGDWSPATLERRNGIYANLVSGRRCQAWEGNYRVVWKEAECLVRISVADCRQRQGTCRIGSYSSASSNSMNTAERKLISQTPHFLPEKTLPSKRSPDMQGFIGMGQPGGKSNCDTRRSVPLSRSTWRVMICRWCLHLWNMRSERRKEKYAPMVFVLCGHQGRRFSGIEIKDCAIHSVNDRMPGPQCPPRLSGPAFYALSMHATIPMIKDNVLPTT